MIALRPTHRLLLALVALTALALGRVSAGTRVIAHDFTALARSGSILVAIGADNALYRSTDGGATFSTVRAATSDSLYAISALGNTFVAAGNSGVVVRSADLGLTWAAATSPGILGDLSALSGKAGATSAANIWVAVSTGGGALYSTNDGQTWAAATFPSGSNKLYGVAYDTTAARWVAVGGSGLSAKIYQSTSASSWAAVTAPSGAGVLHAIAADGAGRFLAVGEGSLTFAATILVSTDGGLAFTDAGSDIVSENLYAVVSTGAGAWTVAGAESVILSYNNGGTPTIVQNPVAGGADITGLTLTADGTVLIAGGFEGYVPPSTGPLTLSIASAQSGFYTLTLTNASVGQSYTVQVSSDLNSWDDVSDSTKVATASTVAWTVPGTGSGPRLFWRVVENTVAL